MNLTKHTLHTHTFGQKSIGFFVRLNFKITKSSWQDPGVGWLLPLGSHKVMDSFAGYWVSVSTIKIVRHFFIGFSFSCCDLMDCFFGPFTQEDLVQFALHMPFNFSSTSRLPRCHFFVVGLSPLPDTERLFLLWQTRSCFVFPTPEEDLWCVAKLSTLEDIVLDVQESRLVALKTTIIIWLLQTHFAWQTKLWLSEDVSVRFNQNLLKQCIHKYYIRLSG